MFTKQHYKAIAEIVKAESDHWEGKQPQVRIAIQEITLKLKDYFATDNPRFDHQKFLVACGLY